MSKKIQIKTMSFIFSFCLLFLIFPKQVFSYTPPKVTKEGNPTVECCLIYSVKPGEGAVSNISSYVGGTGGLLTLKECETQFKYMVSNMAISNAIAAGRTETSVSEEDYNSAEASFDWKAFDLTDSALIAERDALPQEEGGKIDVFYNKKACFNIEAAQAAQGGEEGGSAASTASTQKSYSGMTETASKAGLAGLPDLSKLIGRVIGAALSLVGVIFFALMIYGGVVWMTARGNAEYEKKAMGTIVAAVVGLLIVLGAYTITDFVFNATTGKVSEASDSGAGGFVDCSKEKQTGSVKGCDTCERTALEMEKERGERYRCIDIEKPGNVCTDGTIINNVCLQSGNDGPNIKCCLQK